MTDPTTPATRPLPADVAGLVERLRDAKRETVFGCDLKVGDVIEGLVPEKLHRIVALKPYTGPLAYLFKEGATLASFDNLGTGMTIDHGATFRRVGGF